MNKLFIATILLISYFYPSHAQIISTYAGTGISGYSGDGGQATAAQLGMGTMAVDFAGNVYFCDQLHHCVRKINHLTGIINTVAGIGTGGFTGDGGAATSAQLRSPHNIALDAVGNLYICDLLNHRIRKVDVVGIIHTFAGNVATVYTGDGIALPT